MKPPYDLLETIERLIAKRQEIRDWCKKFIKDVEEQENAINVLKVFLTAVTIIGQGDERVKKIVEVIHLVISIGEVSIKVARDSSLRQKLASDKHLVLKLSEDLKKANKIVDKLMKSKEQDGWSREQATKNVLCAISNKQKIRNYKIRRGVDFDTALVDNIDKIKIEDNVTSVVLKTGFTMGATQMSRPIPGMGAVINVMDCFYSCLSDDPTITSAKKAIKTINNSLVELQRKKRAIESFKS